MIAPVELTDESDAETPEKTVERLRRNKYLLDSVRLAQARLRIERERAVRPDPWSNPSPLVTVRICTYNRPEVLLERSIASVLRQSYQNFEVLVIGDHASPETGEAMARVKDPRVRYLNLPNRPRYPRFPRYFWQTAGTYAMITGHVEARGDWIAPLDDDDEFTNDHLSTLLSAAYSNKADLVYGAMAAQIRGGGWLQIGSGQFACGQICSGAVLFNARFAFLGPDPFVWIYDQPADWTLWSNMAQCGARIAFLQHLVGIHYAEGSSIEDPEERQRLWERIPTVGEILTDVEYTGAQRFLRLA